jgi:hypothetical protein
MKLTWQQVLAWRMERHHLSVPAAKANWRDVVSRIGGLQAQLFSSAELSLCARVEGFEPGSLAAALWEDRTMVKLWAQRGTLHVLPSSEFGLWQSVFEQYEHDRKPSWYRYFGVTDRELDKTIAAIARALEGRMMTREELALEVSRITRSETLGDKLRESWGAILKPASFQGHLCFASNAGRNVRFTNPRTWLPEPELVEPASALPAIARRYLSAYGPATRLDFAHWLGVRPAAAGSAFKRLEDEAVSIDVEGSSMLALASAVGDMERVRPARAVRLLPAFDPYVIAVSPHALHCLPGDFRKRIYRPQGWISPALVVDGRMDGIWQSESKAQSLVVTIEPFVKLPRWSIKAAEAQAERLARFFGLALELRWSDPGS